MRVFLDANVLFSAAYRETESVRVFSALAEAGACSLVTSAHAIEEARRNLAAKYPQRLKDLEALIDALERCPPPRAESLEWAAAAANLPAKDAPILAAAVESRCHLLVTGDKADFGALFGKRLRGTVVMLPMEAIELLVG